VAQAISYVPSFFKSIDNAAGLPRNPAALWFQTAGSNINFVVLVKSLENDLSNFVTYGEAKT